MLNGRRVDIPSIRLNPGDVVTVRPHSQKTEYFKKIDDIAATGDIGAGWLSVNRNKFEIKVTGTPSRDEAEPDINEQLIVEYYSR
jgi:small subunit ribosomal protein S4